MSNKTNYVVTGITIKDLYQDKIINFSSMTKIHFIEISDEEIKWYGLIMNINKSKIPTNPKYRVKEK